MGLPHSKGFALSFARTSLLGVRASFLAVLRGHPSRRGAQPPEAAGLDSVLADFHASGGFTLASRSGDFAGSRGAAAVRVIAARALALKDCRTSDRRIFKMTRVRLQQLFGRLERKGITYSVGGTRRGLASTGAFKSFCDDGDFGGDRD